VYYPDKSKGGVEEQWIMGRSQEPLERDGSPVREFAFWLRDLRYRSGLTYDELGKKAQYATSTVQAATAGNRLPTLAVTMAFVRACGGDLKAWRGYWIQIRRALDQDASEAIRKSVLPPWAGELMPGPHHAANGDEPQRRELLQTADAPGGWFSESCVTLLRLDTRPIESLEQRVIVAAVDNLSELDTSISVPRHRSDSGQEHSLEAELLYGGSLERREQPYESYFMNFIALPRSLHAGERHEYAMRLRIPLQQLMAPHYMHVPHRRTDHFEVRVRFDPARPPRAVWALSGAPTSAIYDVGRLQNMLFPDRFGEVHVSFHNLRLGLSYGVCWQE
jgi:hypothetical protein